MQAGFMASQPTGIAPATGKCCIRLLPAQLAGAAPLRAAVRQLRQCSHGAVMPGAPASRRGAAVVRAHAGEASFSKGAGEVSFQQDSGLAAPSSAKQLKVALYIFLWYGANIWFNRQNKMLLNAFPCPWFIATIQLVGSFLVGLFLWVTRLQPAPDMTPDLWKALAPVALFHTLGHVTACIAFGAMAVSFAHIVKSAEPVFSVLLSAPLLGQAYPPIYVWASLLPIIGGCALSSLNEVTFAWAGFLNASASNVGMVLRNIVSKKMMGKFKNLGGINLFILLSTASFVYCAPLAYVMEGSKWNAALHATRNSIGSQQFAWLVASSAILYTAYNVFSYLVLDLGFSPVTLSVGNSMKRVAVVVSSVIFFQNPVSPLNWAGSALAILGTYLYSLASQKAADSKKQ